MDRAKLVTTIAEAIARHEGYYVTQRQANLNKQPYPTVAQRHNNPGNLRRWNRYPNETGYVRFPSKDAGWAALYALCGQYLDGKYHNGKPPTLREWFATYAPASDKNDPERYARYVASALRRAGLSDVDIDTPVKNYVTT